MADKRYKIENPEALEEEGGRIIIDVEGREIAVFNYNGDYYAVLNYCVHQSGPLCEGRLSGHMKVGDDGWDWEYDHDQKYISCPWHGWKFDITTGESVSDKRYAVPTYEVTQEDGDLYIVHN